MRDLWKTVVDLLAEHIPALIAGIIIAIWGILWGIIRKTVLILFIKRQWRRLQYCQIWLSYKLLSRFRRLGFSLATLDDYVDLLDDLRARLDRRTVLDGNLVIKFYVFTTQLPRDWPLWDLTVTESTPEKTKLEHYALDLRSFIRRHDSIDLKRIIIIENSESPRGKLKFGWLKKDVNNAAYFREYIQKLHKSEDQALYCLYKRPWPSWLSDTVLYGLENTKEKWTEWLWAVTTSYRPGADLMSLRLHRMSEQPMSKKYVIPWAYRSFVTLAEKTADLEGDNEILKLATLRETDATDPPLEHPTPITPTPIRPNPQSASSASSQTGGSHVRAARLGHEKSEKKVRK